mmetsp:Transcript_13421/g.31791  ORF Transcript_13421/g.31791 Transcript_13421/m.31791 type:complete len:302 (-) Transcript_13421:1547-2452(-)
MLLLEDELPKELVLQALHRYCEIHNRHLGAELRGIVRVWQACRAEEFEGVRKVNLLVSQLNDVALALPLKAALQDRVQDGIQVLLNVLDQEGPPKRQAVLQVVAEHLVDELRHLEAVRLLPVHQPDPPLALRIHQHRIACRACDHDAVLHTQLVSREALEVPLANLRVVDKERRGLKILSHRDVELGAVAHEITGEEQLPELLVEGAEVGHKAAGKGTVPGEPLDHVVKFLRLLCPPLLLTSKGMDQSIGCIHLLLCVCRILLQLLLLGHRRIKLGLHLVQLALHDGHTVFRRVLLLGCDL